MDLRIYLAATVTLFAVTLIAGPLLAHCDAMHGPVVVVATAHSP